MAQTATRLNTQSYPISPPSTNMNNLHQIIVFDPILSDYFKNKSSPPQYWQLAYELMLDGLRYRATNQTNIRNCCCNQQKSNSPVKQIQNTQNIKPILKENKNQRNTGQSPGEQKRMKTPSGQKDKHYNVSYVKHQRFLSPSQRKQLVTPKVTQVIPASTAPLVIYGKPRVKIDQQWGCPYHSNQQECLRSIPYGGTCQPRQIPMRVVHIKQPAGSNRNSNNGYESVHPEAEAYQNNLSRYNSTPNLNKNSKHVKEANQEVLNLQKTKKLQNQPKKGSNFEATNSQFKKQKSKNKTIQADQRVPEQRIGNVVYVDKIIQVQSRVPGQMRIVKSPKAKIIHEQYSLSDEQSSYLDARYANESRNKKSASKQVQSKIKFLIERDKRNKEMQKNLKKQQEQIKFLQKMIKQDRAGVDMKTIKVVNGNNYATSASPQFQISNTLRQSLSLSSSQSSQMSMLDSQIVKKYRSNANKGNRRANKGEQEAAYFGVVNQENEVDEQCSCENSYNDDEMSESERQIKIKQSRSSNEDNDQISEYEP